MSILILISFITCCIYLLKVTYVSILHRPISSFFSTNLPLLQYFTQFPHGIKKKKKKKKF